MFYGFEFLKTKKKNIFRSTRATCGKKKKSPCVCYKDAKRVKKKKKNTPLRLRTCNEYLPNTDLYFGII